MAHELEQTYSLVDLQGAIDYTFSANSDGWWAKSISERRSDPFDYLASRIDKIVGPYQQYRAALEAESKRTANKEMQHGNSNSNTTHFDVHPENANVKYFR